MRRVVALAVFAGLAWWLRPGSEVVVSGVLARRVSSLSAATAPPRWRRASARAGPLRARAAAGAGAGARPP